MATAWVQHFDFSATELGTLSERALIKAFEEVDWQNELSKVDAKSDHNSCPPGFGINKGPNILHLCPQDKTTLFFHLHFETSKKFLFLIPFTQKRSHDVDTYPIRKAPWLISQFMAGSYEAILNL